MKKSEIVLGLLRIPVDLGSVLLALFVAYVLRQNNIDLLPNVQLLSPSESLPSVEDYLYRFVLGATAVYIGVMFSLRLYALQNTVGAWREFGRVILGGLLWIALITGWFFLVQRQLFFSRILLVHATLFAVLFSVLGRSLVIGLQRLLLHRGIGVRRVVSCGSLTLPESVLESLQSNPRFHFQKHFGSPEEVDLLHATTPVDLLFHTDPNPTSEGTARLIEYCRSHHIGYCFLPPVFADVPQLLRIEYIGLLPMIRFSPTPLDGWGRVIKRVFDLVASFILLVLLSPIILIIALLILLTSGWPIFYVSERVGQYGREKALLFKFRTMVRNADEQKEKLLQESHRKDGPLFKLKNDPRVTPLGRFLRRWSIDELPQLVNVFAGHLSLVGPRPHLPAEVQNYQSWHRRVLSVRPGVTGLAQISGRSDLPFDEEVRLDLRYIEEWSFTFDLWILWRTVFVVLFGKGAD